MIYIVEKGDFSDRRIVMATTNKEFAYATMKRMQKEINGYVEPSVRVYEFEDGVEAHYLPMWRVELWEDPVTVELEDIEDEEQEWSSTYILRATSAEAALKIAREKQTERKARLEGLI